MTVLVLDVGSHQLRLSLGLAQHIGVMIVHFVDRLSRGGSTRSLEGLNSRLYLAIRYQRLHSVQGDTEGHIVEYMPDMNFDILPVLPFEKRAPIFFLDDNRG